MSMRAKYLGAAGVVIDGKFRDLQEHRNLEFPVSRPTSLSMRLLMTGSYLLAVLAPRLVDLYADRPR